MLPSTANFLLICLPSSFRAQEVRARLISEHSILVRGCDSFAGLEPGRYLRVAVRGEAENARLVEALTSILKGTNVGLTPRSYGEAHPPG